ncbi:hypothetical protein E2C01_087971 [Portunus trituberculatus]|uniref:Uncharacterized protein n=1 Tax=Portunus trituberculatus TaxID=210409 RepID=A0A5B7JD89_PORTR|nr:hypothetical protein [Portunus trituberculatus]
MATARATKEAYRLSARHSTPRHHPFRKSPSLQKDEFKEEKDEKRVNFLRTMTRKLKISVGIESNKLRINMMRTVFLRTMKSKLRRSVGMESNKVKINMMRTVRNRK